MGERTTPLADAFTEIEDVRIAAHLLGDPIAYRVEPAELFRTGRRRGRHRRVERFGVDVAEEARRRRLGCGLPVFRGFGDLAFCTYIDGIEIGCGNPMLV